MDVTFISELLYEALGLSVPNWVLRAAILGVVLVGAFVLSRITARMASRVLDKSEVPSASIFVNICRVAVWSLALLLILRPVFGIEPTAFVATLGIASVALSLGLQDTVSNVFGGLSLMLSKVIVPGDVVCVSGITGVVTDIDWRSTTVRQFNGDLHIIPNSVLSKTDLNKLAPYQANEYVLPVMLAKDADLVQVRAEVDQMAREALGEHYDEEFGTFVFVTEFSNFGIAANISLHTTGGIAPGRARTAMAELMVGKPWLI